MILRRASPRVSDAWLAKFAAGAQPLEAEVVAIAAELIAAREILEEQSPPIFLVAGTSFGKTYGCTLAPAERAETEVEADPDDDPDPDEEEGDEDDEDDDEKKAGA